jgi:hypothetical protein
MRNRSNTGGTDRGPEMEPHDRFVELCALSTSGELSEDEQKDLQAHLEGCAACRRTLQEFEAAAAVGVPLLHSALSSPGPSELQPIRFGDKKEAPPPILEMARTAITSEFSSGRAGGLPPGRRDPMNWNYVWVSFAAAILLTAALGINSFEIGKRRAMETDQVRSKAADARMEALEQQMSDMGHEREVTKSLLAGRDRKIAELERQISTESVALSEARSAQSNLELSFQKTLQSEAVEKQKLRQEQSNLSQQLAAAQAVLGKTQTELASLQQRRTEERSRSESFEAQIRELHGQIRDREQALNREEELLAHDRDIRELMGARELYIAEVYDVAKDGQTKKPYGRVFYTKGKSLVFYAYDLDQQAGLKKAITFQAWGSRGADRQLATSLGVFYEDSTVKKRWFLKSDDPKKLEQIDAVFVTVEPNGGSSRPSGKPLLFAYLKVEPNHP